MAADLRGLGHSVELRPNRRGPRIVLVLGALLVLGAIGARMTDDADPELGSLVGGEPPIEAAPLLEEDDTAASEELPAPLPLPVLGRAGGLLVHVPAMEPLVVSYHEASFAEALPIQPLGTLSQNENPTRPLASEDHPDGVDFHVQVSRGRANASTSAVDVVLPPGEAVRSPITGTVTEVRPYQLYGTHDDVRLELRADDADLSVVLIHIEDVVVQAGDRVEVGDVLAGGARVFPFGAVVDRLFEPDRYGHVHLEVKTPE